MDSNQVSFNIYVMSYKRADRIRTANHLEYCTYVVRESERDEYAKNLSCDILTIPDSVFNDIKRGTGGLVTFEWIIHNTPEDVIAIIDDDMEKFLYRLDTNCDIESPETVTAEIERIAQLIVDLDIGHGCICGTPVPYGYDCEFGFKGIPGGVKWINKAKYVAVCDDEVTHNYDIDLILQELLVNRIILQPKYFCATTQNDLVSGGDSSKSRQEQLDSVLNMKRKWKRYFEFDKKKNVPKIAVKR